MFSQDMFGREPNKCVTAGVANMKLMCLACTGVKVNQLVCEVAKGDQNCL